MRLTLTTFLTLDGVYQAPGGPEEDESGSFAHGGWVTPYFNEEVDAFITSIFEQSGAYLLGRKTYDIFAQFWPNVDTGVVSTGLNNLPKYVPSSTLTTASWSNTTILRGDLIEEVTRLKALPGKELQIHGSGAVAQSLLDAGLVDTCYFMVFPVILGSGKRLLSEGRTPSKFDLADVKSSKTGVTMQTLTYTGTPTYAPMS